MFEIYELKKYLESEKRISEYKIIVKHDVIDKFDKLP